MTDYGYNTLGELSSINRPAPLGDETISYDALSRVNVMTDGRGATVTNRVTLALLAGFALVTIADAGVNSDAFTVLCGASGLLTGAGLTVWARLRADEREVPYILVTALFLATLGTLAIERVAGAGALGFLVLSAVIVTMLHGSFRSDALR